MIYDLTLGASSGGGGGGGGGGHSGTEGAAPALRISRKKGSFFLNLRMSVIL